MGWICNKCGTKYYDKREADMCCSQLIKRKKKSKAKGGKQ
jgi:uncharacterized OB-fold protein